MSANPEVQPIVEVLPIPTEEPAPVAPVAPVESVAPAGYLAYEGKAKAPRPAWTVPAAIAAVGLIVAGMLGYVVFTTSQQRDAARHQLAATQVSLTSTRAQLSSAQADAAQRKAVADYVAVYVADGAKVQTDYFEIVNCTSYSPCRTASQQMLTDMQQFQADRAALTVPGSVVSSDNSLGDALSAAIAADQEFITGIDNGQDSKATEGFDKLDAAMLNMAKAEAALGAELK